MNLTPYLWPKGQLLRLIRSAGAVVAGCARAEYISQQAGLQFGSWVASGANGCMDWMHRHIALRTHPDYVLPGVRTVVCAAFAYAPPRGYRHPHIADYALGLDYHIVLRRRLQPAVDFLNQMGASARICIDTAPLPERYWATKCGLGRTGRSGQLIVPGVGAGVFIATILTTLELEPDAPLDNFDPCKGCRRCIDACPGHAIGSDGTVDARRCLSYLTIEHRGEWPDGAPKPGRRVYGCDICRQVCPHSTGGSAEPLDEFRPRPELMALDLQTLRNLTSGDWRRLTRGPSKPSAMSRLSYRQLQNTLKRLFDDAM